MVAHVLPPISVSCVWSGRRRCGIFRAGGNASFGLHVPRRRYSGISVRFRSPAAFPRQLHTLATAPVDLPPAHLTRHGLWKPPLFACGGGRTGVLVVPDCVIVQP